MRYAALLIMWATACGGESSTGGPDNGSDPDAGTSCEGPNCTPEPDASVEPAWSFGNVYGVPNLDDDDNALTDWNQPLFAADDDISKLVLRADTLALVPAGGDVQLMLGGDVANVRIFRAGQHVLGVEAGAGPYAFTPAGADVELQVEFGNYAVAAQLQIIARDAGGTATDTAAVKLQASPLVMNHHLQPAEHVWAVQVNGNAALIAGYQQALGAKFSPVSGGSYGGDVWIQDEHEFSTLTGDGNLRLDVVIDSIRNRGLDPWAENAHVGPDAIAQTWGNPATRTTYDSFGNLEASPPVTVGTTAYPFGRIYYGRTGNSGLNTQLAMFLASQRVQAPIELPTSWLCVGHVDEFSSFVPDASSPKGFKLVIADVPSAMTLLQGLSPNASIGRYGADHGYATVGSILNDAGLVALNNDIQTTYLDPILAKLKTELGLTDADVIKVPSLFEQISSCGGRVAALIPGMVNLVIAKTDGQTTHLFTADPFFRATGAPQGSDPIIAAFTQRMPAGMQLHFLDNWNTYHMGLGEVHCGTAVRRTPIEKWWTTAMHLLGGN